MDVAVIIPSEILEINSAQRLRNKRSGRRRDIFVAAKGHFAYSVLYDIARPSESEDKRRSRTGIISEAVVPKRSEPACEGRVSDFGITRLYAK